MPEYKSNQCPDCGCEEFIQEETITEEYRFMEGGLLPHKTHHGECVDSPMICFGCEKEIDEFETSEQGKIVLQ